MSLMWAPLAPGHPWEPLKLAGGTLTGAHSQVSPAHTQQQTFTLLGSVPVGARAPRWYPLADIELISIAAAVGTAPTGAALIVDVNQNGTTVFTTQANRPQIAAGSNYAAAGGAPEVTMFTAGTDYMTIDVDQIGSTEPGRDLVVVVSYRPVAA